MIPERKLDMLIAEKVMNWHPATPEFPYWYPRSLHPESNALGHMVPSYSTDIAAAFTVVEKLTRDLHKETHNGCIDGFRLEQDAYTKLWKAGFTASTDVDCSDKHFTYEYGEVVGPSEQKTPSLAICMFALKVLKVEMPAG